jgi:uncharacterized protein YjbI with pentapeptide repeats
MTRTIGRYGSRVPARRARPAPAPRPIRAPQVGAQLEPLDAGTLADDATWHGHELSGDAAATEAVDVDIDRSHLRSVRLTGARLDRIRITDTVLEGCELSGVALEHAVLTRVELRSCRMLGFYAPQTEWHDVRIVDCRVDEANLRMGRGDHVVFESSSLRSVDLYETAWTEARLFDCDLTAARFDKVRLPGVRLHGSTFDDLTGADALRGSVIDSGQLVPLALRVLGALGITLDDDRDPGSPPI